ncbi:M28 family peptidase [candidate division KSB1 bacterium]
MSEFLPNGISGSGDFRAKCVFAGYGINNPGINYNDFESIEIEDKVVLVMDGVPPIENVDWDGRNSTNQKAGYCLNNGAKGIIILRNPIGVVRPFSFKSFPIINANSKVFNNLLSGTGWDVKAIKDKISETSRPLSFDLRSEVYLNVKTEFKKQSPAMNVVGYLEGSDPELKNEVVVVGAHLDHIGKWGDLIFHGANDNGSGSSIVIEIAEAFATAKYKSRRSLLFILFTGEEMGLIGAFHYVANPLFPLEKTVAMVNMDVIGSGYDGIMVVGGQKFKNFQNLFKFYNSWFIHDTIKDRPMSRNSDHWPFASQNIPAVFLYYMGGRSPYHHPGDIPLRLNPDAMESAGRLVFFVVNDIANRKEINLK